MTTFYDYVMEAEHRRDDIIEAEKERLARQVSKPGWWVPRLCQEWLVRLGERLVVWGRQLQTRFAHALDVSDALQAKITDKEGSPSAGPD